MLLKALHFTREKNEVWEIMICSVEQNPGEQDPSALLFPLHYNHFPIHKF